MTQRNHVRALRSLRDGPPNLNLNPRTSNILSHCPFGSRPVQQNCGLCNRKHTQKLDSSCGNLRGTRNRANKSQVVHHCVFVNFLVDIHECVKVQVRQGKIGEVVAGRIKISPSHGLQTLFQCFHFSVLFVPVVVALEVQRNVLRFKPRRAVLAHGVAVVRCVVKTRDHEVLWIDNLVHVLEELCFVWSFWVIAQRTFEPSIEPRGPTQAPPVCFQRSDVFLHPSLHGWQFVKTECLGVREFHCGMHQKTVADFTQIFRRDGPFQTRSQTCMCCAAFDRG